jgi:hypothetical protein
MAPPISFAPRHSRFLAIIREHKAALTAYDRAAVAGTVRRAGARADDMECGAEVRHVVRGEYAKMARN